MDDYLTFYGPDNFLKKGYLSIFVEMFNDLIKNRWLTYQLFKRDFIATYKQSFVGVLWAVIVPIIGVSTFIILNRSGIFSLGEIDIPYPIYVIYGMAFWQLFSIGLIAGSNSLVKAGPMIIKINFSKKSLVVASVGQSIVPFLIQFILASILCLYYQIIPNTVILLLIPLLIIPTILLSLGFSFILSLLNGIVRDIGNLITIFMTFLMFFTPVLYAKPPKGILAVIMNNNLLYYLINCPREIILKGKMTEWIGFLISSIISIIIFIVCLLVFHLAETRIAERV